MLKEIISKEIFNNFNNLRFIIGTILCVFLTISCVMILTNDYKKEVNNYNLRLNIQDEFLNKYAHTNRIGGMIIPQKPPDKFHPLITGIPKDAEDSFDDNPLSVLFSPFDFLFIVTIIMSLMAIMFSYDTLTGEREQGTLKFLVSFPLSRAKIITGKWIGGTVSLLIPFILSLLVGVIYISINPAVNWDITTWASLVLIILASVIFISSFYLLGLTVSSFMRLSSASILCSLFLWVLFILIIPNLSPYISAQIYRAPSFNKIQREVNILTNIERDDLGRKFSKEVDKRFQDKYGTLFTEFKAMKQDEVRKRVNTDKEFKAMQEAYREEDRKAWSEANRIQHEKAEVLYKDLLSKSDKQNKIAKNITCISPYANFIYIATDISGTGLRNLEYFDKIVREYSNAFYKYLDIKSKEELKKDPTFNVNTFLNVSDRPRFVFKEEPLNNKLKDVLPYFGLLIFFNILFFILTFMKFIRYDVR